MQSDLQFNFCFLEFAFHIFLYFYVIFIVLVVNGDVIVHKYKIYNYLVKICLYEYILDFIENTAEFVESVNAK